MKRLSGILLALVAILMSIFLVSCSCDKDVDTGDALGHKIHEYVVVIPENADTTTKYAAENLSMLVEERTGKGLSVVGDNTKAAEKEILIGETNRQESKTSTQLGDMEYLLFMKNNKIVIKGNGIYVGAGCGDLINKALDISSNRIVLSKISSKESSIKYTPNKSAKNVIFMIGDGMGDVHIELGEHYGIDGFVAREFPNIGKSVTRSQSVIDGTAVYTDSAASGTAMATGYKTINKYIGLNKNKEVIPNVRELAAMVGAKTAVITTDVITGATPSSYMCHCESREDTMTLQSQIDALISERKIDYCAGDVGDNLRNEIKNALKTISKDGAQFFIMIEEGIIDKKAHSNDEEGVASTVKRFDDAIEFAAQFALCHPDTALIVTADHETGKLDQVRPGIFAFRSYNHTNRDVSIFALGPGTEIFNGERKENIELGKFCASVYSKETFGQTEPIE